MTKPIRTADEAGVAAQEKDLKNREASLDIALRDIMNTALGRAWIWDLIGKCGLFRSAWRDDPRLAAFACGEQNVGIQILTQIHRVCPEQYAQAMREASHD